MTDERIQEIKALCEVAKPRPWICQGNEYNSFNIFCDDGVPCVATAMDEGNAMFIAAARQIIPELLEALENKAAEVELWKGGVDRERTKRLIEEDRANVHHEDFMALAAKKEKLARQVEEKERLLINAAAQFSNLQLRYENEISNIERKLIKANKDLHEERERRYRISYNLEVVSKALEETKRNMEALRIDRERKKYE